MRWKWKVNHKPICLDIFQLLQARFINFVINKIGIMPHKYLQRIQMTKKTNHRSNNNIHKDPKHPNPSTVTFAEFSPRPLQLQFIPFIAQSVPRPTSKKGTNQPTSKDWLPWSQGLVSRLALKLWWSCWGMGPWFMPLPDFLMMLLLGTKSKRGIKSGVTDWSFCNVILLIKDRFKEWFDIWRRM